MKKLAVTALTLILALNQSQASTTTAKKVSVSQQHLSLKTRTQTKSVLARVVPRARRQLVTTDVTDDDPAGPDELDLQSLYRRPRLVTDIVDDDDVSDYVSVRLAVIRAKAMEKYRETWC